MLGFPVYTFCKHKGLPMLSYEDVLTVTKQGKEMQAHLFWKIPGNSHR